MTEPASSGDPKAANGRREGISLGRIAGIRVVLAYSWFIIAAFTVIVYGPVLEGQYPDMGVAAYYVAFAYALLLLISVLVHELAHALTAKIFHWPTEKIVLNLWGGHTQFEGFTATPGRSVLVAMAGPAANFAPGRRGLAVHPGSGPVRRGGHPVQHLCLGEPADRHLQRPSGPSPRRRPPRGIRRLESHRQPGKGHRGRGLGGPDHRHRAWPPGSSCFRWLRGDRPDVSLMLITVLVGSFLWMGASASIQHGRLRSRLHLVNAAALAEPAVGIPESSTVADVRQLAADGATAIVLCGPDGRPAGIVDEAAVASVPAGAAATTPATAVSHALSAGAYVPEWSQGQELVQYLAQLEGREYAVVDHHGKVTGLLRQSAVVTAITGKEMRRSGRAKARNR